jgi:hypothetical protein
MNIDFLTFSTCSINAPIIVMDPIQGKRTTYSVEDAFEYVLHYRDIRNQDAESEAYIQRWWTHKWYVALDYYLTSPVSTIAPPIEKKNPIKDSMEHVIPLSIQQVKAKLTTIQAILARRTYREFDTQPISWPVCSALLRQLKHEYFPAIWQYYLVALTIDQLPAGIYRFYSQEDGLASIQEGNYRDQLTEALCGFYPTRTASFTVILAIDLQVAQTVLPYNRALREIYIDAGKIAQRLLIKGIQYDIGGVPIAMRDQYIGKLLQVDTQKIMPVQSITMGLIPKQ